MAELLKGAPVARALTEELAARCTALRERGVVPTLAIVRVGEREHKPLQMEIPAVDPALPHKMQLKHFVKVVRREVEPVVTPADNVKTLTLLNAIKEAAETGQLVEL